MVIFLKKIFISRDRGREGERERNIRVREKHQCVAASCTSPTGNLACSPGMCPEWESNRQPFALPRDGKLSARCRDSPYLWTLPQFFLGRAWVPLLPDPGGSVAAALWWFEQDRKCVCD